MEPRSRSKVNDEQVENVPYEEGKHHLCDPFWKVSGVADARWTYTLEKSGSTDAATLTN